MDFVNATRDYRSAKKDAERHTILLRWILEQVPLVEAELKESEAAESRPITARGTKRKLGHDQDKVSKDRNPKRPRRNDQAIPSGSITTAQQAKKRNPGAVPTRTRLTINRRTSGLDSATEARILSAKYLAAPMNPQLFNGQCQSPTKFPTTVRYDPPGCPSLR
jgi:hypothetical protein